MATVILPSLLRQLVDGRAELMIEGANAGEVLRHLEDQYPTLRGWILDERHRVREHVNIFCNQRLATLDHQLEADDRLHIIQAISGGNLSNDDAPLEREVLVGTEKGLYIARFDAQAEHFELGPRHFPGQAVEFALRDARTGTYFAAVTHGQFGPRIFFSDDLSGAWQQAQGPVFPEHTDTATTRVWAIELGEAPGELWAGVAPAALFHSTDSGRSWTFNEALWNVPGREQWEGGLGGLCLHSICPWPGDPDRLAVGISSAGVWISTDRGKSWSAGGRGLVARYLPEAARQDTQMLCVHDMRRAPRQPETLFMQFHGGVYRSDDGGFCWTDIGAGLPADFGFPIAIDPHDPKRAFVIPLNSDEDRVTAESRLRVFETRDSGRSWRASTNGLPQDDANVTVLRQAFHQDGRKPLGLFFGARSGEFYGSLDDGRSWRCLAARLPPILAVRAS